MLETSCWKLVGSAQSHEWREEWQGNTRIEKASLLTHRGATVKVGVPNKRQAMFLVVHQRAGVRESADRHGMTRTVSPD